MQNLDKLPKAAGTNDYIDYGVWPKHLINMLQVK
jgi:hypothetical protein